MNWARGLLLTIYVYAAAALLTMSIIFTVGTYAGDTPWKELPWVSAGVYLLLKSIGLTYSLWTGRWLLWHQTAAGLCAQFGAELLVGVPMTLLLFQAQVVVATRGLSPGILLEGILMAAICSDALAGPERLPTSSEPRRLHHFLEGFAALLCNALDSLSTGREMSRRQYLKFVAYYHWSIDEALELLPLEVRDEVMRQYCEERRGSFGMDTEQQVAMFADHIQRLAILLELHVTELQQ